MNELLFLKPNVQVEPLFDRWYAWPHLIPPATAARNLSERHLKIMDSYISAPQLHASAVKNPKMLGGPFIDYREQRVPEIAALRAATVRSRPHLLELSSAIADLDSLLRESAKGQSLQPLYEKVPQCLKGYVELVYDRENHADFRILESLLYRSHYYDRSAQGLALSLLRSDDRPFVLSTPRLDSDDCLYLSLSFDRAEVDEIFRLKTTPRPWTEIRELLSVEGKNSALLRTFLTEEPARAYSPYQGSGLRWRYFGHACILIETKDASLLFDPVLSYSYSSGLPRYTYEDLPEKIDNVLITHNHQDHVLLETLLQIRHKTGRIILPRSGNGFLQDPSLKLTLENCGFHNIVELGDMEEVAFPSGSIVALPFLGEHADLNIRTKSAYAVRIGSHSLLFAADSCNVEPRLYDHIYNEVGNISALFLGMECDGAPLTWLYGPLLTLPIERSMDHSRRLSGSDFEQAMSIVKKLQCKQVYVYAMGQEPWLNYIMSIKYTKDSRPIVESERLLAECRQSGMVAERLYGEKEMLLQDDPINLPGQPHRNSLHSGLAAM